MTNESWLTCGSNRIGRKPSIGRHTDGQEVVVRTGRGVRLGGGGGGEDGPQGHRCRVTVEQG